MALQCWLVEAWWRAGWPCLRIAAFVAAENALYLHLNRIKFLGGAPYSSLKILRRARQSAPVFGWWGRPPAKNDEARMPKKRKALKLPDGYATLNIWCVPRRPRFRRAGVPLTAVLS